MTSSNTQIADPFDPISLRMDPTSETEHGVKKPLLHVPVRRPSRQEYFRTYANADYRVPMAILDLKEEREVYAVTPAVAVALPGETRTVELRVCISRAGSVFLWPVPLPAADGRENPWHKTARLAAEHAEKDWVRMIANMGAGCYDILVAASGLSEPVWPEATFCELLHVAFGNGRLIDTVDHPVIQRLRGL
jgi:hypothetical protein